MAVSPISREERFAATVRIEMNRRRICSVQVEKIGGNGYLQGMLIGI
tara:strand:- start:451 stop:591 length:141 start_codon:yes stop_codon:yes gene_type:complete